MHYHNNKASYPNNQRSEKLLQELPQKYLISCFSSDGKNIDEDLITGKVQKLAKYLMTTNLTSTQLRRFYDECVRYEKLSSFAEKKTKLQLLVAKVAYGVGRKVLPNEFLDFFKNRVERVQEEKDFEFYLQHFEAFVAWFNYKPPEDKKK